MKKNFLNLSALMLAVVLLMTACEKEEYKIPDPVSDLSTDVIKRTLGPNIVGLPIEFAFAMAIPKDKGKLVSAQVEASIAGQSTTFLENYSYYTLSSGKDTGVLVGSPSVNKANATSVTYTVDTTAATLRYYYVIPEEARGKTVSFTFSATASNGKTSTQTMGPYNISKMDIVRNLAVSNNNMAYVSIADMAVYNSADAATNAAKIDLVYLYRSTPSTFSHALVSPGADPQYLPGVTLPTGLNRSTKLLKTFNALDWNLVRSWPFFPPNANPTYTSSTPSGSYIDDKDFQDINLSAAPNYALGLKAEAGTWVETTDGKYKAFIFLNSVNANGSAAISILRYPLQ